MSDASSNGESKFGFKDKEKAKETLIRLENHDMQYRKLTVRGLLGRAKRVLSMTKAEDKLKNISEAIDVFEKWLDENGGGAGNQNSKTDKEDKVETVPGLGFKDKEAAKTTLKILEDRDPEYQKFAIKGLISSAKRVLAGTKNEEKIKSIKEGIQILEDFLEKFETENMMKDNRAYLPYSFIEKLPEPIDELQAEFIKTYGGPKVHGNYKHLRTLYPEGSDQTSWDIVRNRNIKKILEKIKTEERKLFNVEDGKPTELHMQLIHWAYSPQPDKMKAYIEQMVKEKQAKAEKRKCDENLHEINDPEEIKEKIENGPSPEKKVKAS